jgi:hypothetical protein
MTPAFLVFRRNFAGVLEATIETEVRVTKHDRPVGDRFVLTPEHLKFSIDDLTKLAEANKLEIWRAPAPAAKDVKTLNAKLAAKETKL